MCGEEPFLVFYYLFDSFHHSLSFYYSMCVILKRMVCVKKLYLCQKEIYWILVEGCVTYFLLCFALTS
jgi:hypothetical protein